MVHLIDGTSLEEVLEALKAPGEILKETPRRRVRRIGNRVLKSSRFRWGSTTLKHTFKRKRYRAGWRAACHLRAKGIDIACPRAFVERRAMGVIFGNAYLCDYLEGFRNIHEHAKGLAAAQVGRDEFRSFLQALAGALAKLEQAGAVHRDLTHTNILTDDGRRFYFVDLDDVLLDEPYTEAFRLKNHVQLYIGLHDSCEDDIFELFIEELLPPGRDLAEWMEKIRAGYRDVVAARARRGLGPGT